MSEAKRLIPWLYKRIVRLVKPYYGYVLIHALLIILLPAWFDRVKIAFTPSFIFDTLFLVGGFSQNWIPRLFVLMTFLYGLYEFIRQRMRKPTSLIIVPLGISLFVSILFMLFPSSVGLTSVKYIQTLTWVALFFFGMLMFQNYHNRRFIYWACGICAILFVSLSVGLGSTGHSISIFRHEYPPTLLYISYGIFATLSLWFFAQNIAKSRLVMSIIRPGVVYLSSQSYTLFFAHIIVMDIFDKPTGFWLSDYLIIASLTVLLIFCLDKALKFRLS